MTDNETHMLYDLLLPWLDRRLRIEFNDGAIFLLIVRYPIDTEIYHESGGWSGQVVSMVSDPDNKFHRPGNGLDFDEQDILRIVNEDDGQIIFESA